MKPRAKSTSVEAQHYFVAEPASRSDPTQVRVSLRGLTLELWTDRGVFSHGGVDRGSRLLAERMELKPGARVLDWGAGYGLLGIVAAALCPDCAVTLVEVNQRAAALAERNTKQQGLPRARVICGQAPAALGEERFDVIISNPPLRAGRAAVEALIADAEQRLTPGGELWLVVPTNKGAKRFLSHMVRLFSEARTVAISGGYRVLWAKKEEGKEQ